MRGLSALCELKNQVRCGNTNFTQQQFHCWFVTFFGGVKPQVAQKRCWISMTTTWVPWYDILLIFLRVGLTKIWELGTDPIAIRGSAVLDGPVCRQCKHHILNIITQWPPIESRDIKCSCRA